jgi:hypothetical protein
MPGMHETPRLSLHDTSDGNDQWYYLLPHIAGQAAVIADGAPMIQTQATGWWAIDREVESIEIATPGHPRILGWQLRDQGAASLLYPPTLSVEEFEKRDSERNDDFLRSLYERITEPGAPSVTVIEGPWTRLDGIPDYHRDYTWHADLPTELRTHPEYRHLFPGRLYGFREALIERVKLIPGVQYALDRKTSNGLNSSGWVDITVSVPFDPPQFIHEPARNQDGKVSRSRPGRDVQQHHHWRLSVYALHTIEGTTKEEAVQRWVAEMVHVVSQVEEATKSPACPHCDGSGIVRPERAEVPAGRTR